MEDNDTFPVLMSDLDNLTDLLVCIRCGVRDYWHHTAEDSIGKTRSQVTEYIADAEAIVRRYADPT